jgi:integrase
LIPEAKRVLRDHRRTPAVHSIDGYVFHRGDGRPIDERRIGERWAQLLTDAGVEHRRFHATRHTAATLLLEADVPLEVVSAILGHANLAITADTYAKVRGDLKRRGLTKLGDAQ